MLRSKVLILLWELIQVEREIKVLWLDMLAEKIMIPKLPMPSMPALTATPCSQPPWLCSRSGAPRARRSDHLIAFRAGHVVAPKLRLAEG